MGALVTGWVSLAGKAKAVTKAEADSLRGIACSSSASLAAPYVADAVFVALPLVAGGTCGGRREQRMQQQIPFGALHAAAARLSPRLMWQTRCLWRFRWSRVGRAVDDENSECNSRFPSGMTNNGDGWLRNGWLRTGKGG